MNKNKFRFWSPEGQVFVQNYKYNGFVDELFEEDKFLIPQQFIGILDKNLKEIYEGDVVKAIYGLEGIEVIGEVKYSCDRCAYFIGDCEISNIEFDSLEIVGNMVEDYTYDENGELILRWKKMKSPTLKQKVEMYEKYLHTINSFIMSGCNEGISELINNADMWSYAHRRGEYVTDTQRQKMINDMFWKLCDTPKADIITKERQKAWTELQKRKEQAFLGAR